MRVWLPLSFVCIDFPVAASDQVSFVWNYIDWLVLLALELVVADLSVESRAALFELVTTDFQKVAL